MSRRTALKNVAQSGIRAAEKAVDRVRYDVLHRGEDAQTVIVPYAGYRTGKRLVLRGRVVESWPRRFDVGDSKFAKLRNMFHLYESDEVPGLPLTVTVDGKAHEVVTDDEGYFALLLDDDRPLPDETRWETATVSFEDWDGEEKASILAPAKGEGLAVITDIDDTVLETGATDLLRNWKRLLIDTPDERDAVPGAANLFAEISEDGSVPVFYVSSSPWNLYGYLERFLKSNALPKGPMFLRDYGIDDVKFITGAHTDHKIEAAKHLLAMYPDRKFLLVGDDGQKDVDVYAEAAGLFPDRVLGIFIRDAHGDGKTASHTEKIAALREKGVRVYFGKTLEEAVPVIRELGA